MERSFRSSGLLADDHRHASDGIEHMKRHEARGAFGWQTRSGWYNVVALMAVTDHAVLAQVAKPLFTGLASGGDDESHGREGTAGTQER